MSGKFIEFSRRSASPTDRQFTCRRASSPQARRDSIAEIAALKGDAGRIVIKACGREILHKTEVGGVSVVDVHGPEDVDAAVVSG